MPLQIRRGTTAERLSITPLIGELIYDTTTGELFVGNGTTPGGSSAISGITVEVAQDAAATLFTSGSHTGINFVYNDETNTINATVTATSSGTFDGDVIGSVFADNSTLLVDGVAGKIVGDIVSANANITNTLTSANIQATSVTSDSLQTDSLTIAVGGNVNGQGSTLGNFSTISATSFEGTLSGTVLGIVDGEVTGSVFADNSTLLVDGVDGRIVGPLYASLYKSDTSLIVDHTTGAITGSSLTINETDDLALLALERKNAGDTAVNINDVMLRIEGRGWNGSNYITGSRIQSTVTEALGSGLPCDIRFLVNDDTDNLFTYMSIIGGSVERIEAYKPFNIFHNGYVSPGSVFGVYQYHNNVDADNVVFARTRGSDTAQTAVQNGDDIVDISFLAHHGSGYAAAVSMSVVVDDTFGGTQVPGRFVLRTNNGSTGTVERLSIDHVGTTTITGSLNVVGDITGTLISGSSSMMIDTASGSLMVANINLQGETGNTPSTPGSVDSWLELTVNGVTKYMPLYV